MINETTGESIKEKLEKVRQSYISTLIEKRNAIDTHWSVLKENADEETGSKMYLIIHGIAGSAETFGFPELTKQARSTLDYIKEVNTANSVMRLTDEINRELEKLIVLLERLSE